MPSITLKPQKMTEEIMTDLEEHGLIIRLTPSKKHHRLEVSTGGGKGEYMYQSSPDSGTHSVMNVALDFTDFSNFATHPDNEEFLLLGGINEKKLYLLISLISREELETRLTESNLHESDLICLEAVFNDPELSFFIMKKGVPHGESTRGDGDPVTFYVTEGSMLAQDLIDITAYSFNIES